MVNKINQLQLYLCSCKNSSGERLIRGDGNKAEYLYFKIKEGKDYNSLTTRKEEMMNRPQKEGMSIKELLEACRQHLNDLKQAHDHIPLELNFPERAFIPISHGGYMEHSPTSHMLLCVNE